MKERKHGKLKKIILIVIAVLVAFSLFLIAVDGTFLPSKYASVWDEKYINSLKTDGEKIIAGALRSSSGHNMQPWLVRKIDENTYDLFADLSKDLKVIDPEHKLLLIGQGVFIENYVQTASQLGYQTNVQPQVPNFNDKLPGIAHLVLKKSDPGQAVDAVSSSTIHSDSAELMTMAALDQKIGEIMKSFDSLSYQLVYADGLAEMKSILLKGVETEAGDRAAMEEQNSAMRWTEWDKNKYRYGLGIPFDNPVSRHLAQPFMKLLNPGWESSGKQWLGTFKKQLASDLAYILIKSRTSDPVNFVLTGRAYQTIGSNIGGYSLRPSYQVLEGFATMKGQSEAFQAKYGSADGAGGEVTMILRVWDPKGSTIFPGPRHLVEDIMIP